MTGLRLSGVLGVAFWFIHAVDSLWRGEPNNMLWCCNLAALFVGVSQVWPQPTLNAVGVLWFFWGVPIWVLELLTGGALIWTSALTHVGGWAVGLYGVRRLGIPRGIWWKTLAAGIALQGVCRLLTPPHENVNICWSIWAGWEKHFPSYFVYWLGLVALSGTIFFSTEWALSRVTEKAPA